MAGVFRGPAMGTVSALRMAQGRARSAAERVQADLVRKTCPCATRSAGSAAPVARWRSTVAASPIDERATREDLAAVYRLAHMEGWSPDLIYNHATARVGGSDTDPAFLINPYGAGYEEVTASSLVVVNANGDVLDRGTGTGEVNKAGFVVHSAVHVARPELHAVIHTHHPDAAAVSAMDCGLLPLTQDAIVFGEVASHEYEGIAVDTDEAGRIARDLGATANVLLLRNHGVVVGGKTIPEMFVYAYFVHKACTTQVRALSMQGGSYRDSEGELRRVSATLPRAEVVSLTRRQALAFNEASGAGFGQLEWRYLRRKLDAVDESYKL